VEDSMQTLETRKAALDALIADATLYEEARRDERVRVLAEHGEITRKLGEQEEQWLSLQNDLEDVEKQVNG
jgi:ATP-binding cassette subfamily F protein 3